MECSTTSNHCAKPSGWHGFPHAFGVDLGGNAARDADPCGIGPLGLVVWENWLVSLTQPQVVRMQHLRGRPLGMVASMPRLLDRSLVWLQFKWSFMNPYRSSGSQWIHVLPSRVFPIVLWVLFMKDLMLKLSVIHRRFHQLSASVLKFRHLATISWLSAARQWDQAHGLTRIVPKQVTSRWHGGDMSDWAMSR